MQSSLSFEIKKKTGACCKIREQTLSFGFLFAELLCALGQIFVYIASLTQPGCHSSQTVALSPSNRPWTKLTLENGFAF